MRDCIDIYSIETRLPVTSIQPISGLNAPIMFIHEGRSLMATTDNNTVRLWEISGDKLATILHDGQSLMASYGMLNLMSIQNDQTTAQ